MSPVFDPPEAIGLNERDALRPNALTPQPSRGAAVKGLSEASLDGREHGGSPPSPPGVHPAPSLR